MKNTQQLSICIKKEKVNTFYKSLSVSKFKISSVTLYFQVPNKLLQLITYMCFYQNERQIKHTTKFVRVLRVQVSKRDVHSPSVFIINKITPVGIKYIYLLQILTFHVIRSFKSNRQVKNLQCPFEPSFFTIQLTTLQSIRVQVKECP